ncbi:hypothetical protein DTO013E5_8055 [Penicillium roqueforti]|uniref:Genomic scaffold, ProqFM164S04 n=1 Tax=Penicillium roqueforti (strain FM164) TaxID=1365484 RepID=W6QMR3_PENRF|nr:uncharacterized protein LCP9604111_7698 [Penicillium roqueforti]CDM35459.1 unnamed protein product [Penicillium roqueforti FM164]KAF9243315.1 hypothetical protein LCP9604111_7698 [Penicillium roqueforti]KAI1833855.1 hypothetical protein CBS147337_5410 [Penicillium roqueforti]KAI2685746.1 hypothetical protein CBS147355_1233 [Penicillium roqueforti]KAI2691937.1 hypothetical protein LCP963914a_31 [Penicillium roqueforti]
MPVGPRVSKEEFMLALGLNPQDPHHEQYYRAMRDEAIIVYNRMNLDTSNLLDNVRADPATRPPFFWHHIRPDCQRWAILEICHNAPPLVRGLFERGATNGEYGPNWVAGWLLYSVFRSRDVRNNRNRRKGEVGGSAGSESDRRTRQEEPKKYYDPVRNGTL